MKKLLQFIKAFYDQTFYTRGGYYTWVAAGITVVTAVGGAVAANQQQKKAQKAAQGLANQQTAAMGKNVFRPPTLPQYVPFDFNQTQKEAIKADASYYARSDKDFGRRHGSLAQAEKLFETSVLKDQQGEHELMPALQNELTRAGIGSTLDAFGDGSTSGAPLAAGSAGEANVARNLGLGILGFQDRNRANRERSLTIAEDLFPRRTFGMSGADLASSAVSDVNNTNAFNAAQYERDFAARAAQVGQFQNQQNAQMQSQNAAAAAKAEADAARTAAIVGAATTAINAGAKAYGQAGTTSVSGAARPTMARYPGSTTWVPVGRYA